MEIDAIFSKLQEGMSNPVDHVLQEFSKLHTGKASPSIVENLDVVAYGSTMKLRDMAAITTPDPRTIQIQPWDKSATSEIEQALLTSKIGITPLVAGEVIRLPMPELSGERREELCKVAQGIAEQGRVGIRSVRKEILDALKTRQKEGLSEDEFKRCEKEVQVETDAHVQRINDSLSTKEKELRQV